MDLSPPILIAHPEGQNHDRIDAEMGTEGLSSDGNTADPAASTVFRADTSELGVEVMDVRPDQSDGEVDESLGNHPHESASAEPGTGAVGGETPTPQPDGSVMVGTTPAPPLAEGANLVRVTSHGSSIDSEAGMEIVLPANIASGTRTRGDWRVTELPGTSPRRTINVPPPPPPPRPESPSPPDEHDEELQDDEEDPWWTDLVEDTSTPNPEELKEIEQAGPEISALDRKWR